MEKDRFTLQQCEEPNFWTVTDNEHGISLRFREHEYNTTQQVILLGGNTFNSVEQAMNLATYMREMGDWIFKNHYSLAMPSLIVMRQNLGATIRNIRERRNMTQQELAAKAGITTANVCNIEAGKYSVGIDILNKVCNALDVKIEITE